MKTFKQFLESKPIKQTRHGRIECEFTPSTINKYVETIETYLKKKLKTKNISRGRWLVITSALKMYKLYLPSKTKEIDRFLAGIEQPVIRRHHEKHLLDDEKWRQLYDNFGKLPAPKNHILQLLAYSGLRIGDIKFIEKAEIERAKGGGEILIRVKSGRKERYVFSHIEQYLLPLLKWKDWTYLYELLSDSENGYYQILYWEIKRQAANIGLDPNTIHPHLFRHNFTKLAHQATGDIVQVQQLLRHRSLNTTRRYITLNPKLLSESMKKIDMERFKK